MLVRDRGDFWQLVRQPDHADLSGQLARAWGGELPASSRPASLALAATRHDDGWAVYDRRPGWDAERGRPRNFLDVPVLAHLAFYRACIQVVSDEDAYAGALVAMHGAGIYNGRYGTQPGLSLTFAGRGAGAVDAFVAEQEAALRGAARGSASPRRSAGATTCSSRSTTGSRSRSVCASGSPRMPSPRRSGRSGGGRRGTELQVEPVGPWRVRIDPYPFRESPARFTLVRKLLLQAPFRVQRGLPGGVLRGAEPSWSRSRPSDVSRGDANQRALPDVIPG